jgi:hypothetical protein
VKSTEEHRALQLLDQAGDYANRAETLTVVDDDTVNAIRATVGVGVAILGLIEELRQYRKVGNFPTSPGVQQNPPIIVKCECAAGHEGDPARHTEIRAVRGQLVGVLVVMNVLLVVLCVVLAIT